MATNNYTKYDEDFKKSLVSLHQNGKTQTQLFKEYGVSQSALGKWIKQYSTVEKKEETNRRTYHSLQELLLSVFEYIEGFYNSRRPHGSLGMLTPNQVELLFSEHA